MVWVATGIVGGAVINALASNSAANTQADAANQASANSLAATTQSNQLQAGMYQQGMVNEAPSLQAGQEATAALTAGLGLNNYGLSGGTSTAYGNGAVAPAGTEMGGSATSNAGITNYAGNGTAATSPGIGAGGNTVMTPGATGVSSALAGLTATNGSQIGGAVANTANGASALPTSTSSLLPVTNYGASTGQMQQAAASQMTANGQGALNQTFAPSDLTLSPAYQFQLQQGTANLDASAAATGMLGSGQNLKDVTNYGQNAAQNAYQAAYSNFNQNQNQTVSRLQSLAGVGNSAANVATNAASTTGGNIANTTMAGTAASNNYLTSGAAAQAAGTVGVANAASGAANNYIGMQYLNNLAGGGTNGVNNNLLTGANSAGQAGGMSSVISALQ